MESERFDSNDIIDDIIDDIFDDHIKQDSKPSLFLTLLEKYLPESGFAFVPRHGETMVSGNMSHVPGDICARLHDTVNEKKSRIGYRLPDGAMIQAIPVPELDGVLIHDMPSQLPEIKPEDFVSERIQLCVDLYMEERNLQSRLETVEVQEQQLKNRLEINEEQHRETMLELIQANEATEAANIAKRDFLARMSHEIRTPLHGIIGMIDLAMDMGLSPDQKDTILTIEKEANNLHHLINDILDFSKIEAGKLDVDEISFDLRVMFEDVTYVMARRVEKKGLTFASFLSPEIPTKIIGDPGRIRQILYNLIGNALKFTAEGKISVRVEMAERAPAGILLRFAVEDTGIGIAKDKQENLFDSFTQVDGSITRTFGGTGLGTAISKELASLMGGDIGIESSIGEGSTFWFTVRVREQGARKDTQPWQDYRLTGKRVLVVDDNPTYRHILCEYLKMWECVVVEAGNGEEALVLAGHALSSSDKHIDLILTDILMPEMDGFEMARQLRKMPAYENLPIIALTGFGLRGDGLKCKEMGFSAYLIKPVGLEDLYRAIVPILGFYQQGETDEKPELITRHYLAETARKEIQILVADDYETNREVAIRHLSKAGYQVDVVENGDEALMKVKQKRYGLILMDLHMPVMDGYQATEAIRLHEEKLAELSGEPAFRTPIVAMTADAVSSVRDQCLRIGMDDFLPKPSKSKDMIDIADKWTIRKPGDGVSRSEMGKSEDGIKEPEAKMRDPETEKRAGPEAPEDTSEKQGLQRKPPGDAPLDFSGALEEYEGDREFLMELLGGFLDEAGREIKGLQEALSADDSESVRKGAHAIKGGSAILKANTLSGLAASLEDIGRSEQLAEGPETLEQLETEFDRLAAYVKDINDIDRAGNSG